MNSALRLAGIAMLVAGLAGATAAPAAAQPLPPPPANVEPPPPPQTPPGAGQYSSLELVDAGHHFFGGLSRGLASVVEKAISQWGQPNG